MKYDMTIDRRIRKSKRAIREALVKLLSNKKLDDITITEIAQVADVNRKTFYNYYETPYQVVEEIENDIILSLDEILLNINFKEDLKQPIKIFEKLTNIIQEDFEFYSDLMKTQKIEDNNLILKISETLKQHLKNNMPTDLFENQLIMELAINYTVSGMLEVYKEWLLNSQNISLEKLSQDLSTIIFSGLNSIIVKGE